ncbi:hypothetical protein EJB05_01974 [Eragrostis curvula]|uniref:Uncharacterized protein n=1 Tax=Eragrostis curvula TaxID=38414 RepID=A0A5J9WRP3_9POAL|nr:hypothetical protein EJB05_01974 [Eragrostis curvula]
MEKARRRRHVPAFGEWNYYSSSSSPDEPQLPPSGGAAAAASAGWSWYAPEPEACSDVWFRYSPPPRRPAPKKVRRPAVAPEKMMYYSGGKGSVVPAAAAAPRGRASGSGAAALTPARGARRVVRPVDKDLYQVPPPDSGRSRRKKSLWMGCLGLNCVA